LRALTLGQLPEHQLGGLELVLVRDSLGEREGRGESGSELKDGFGRSSKGVTLLPEKDVCREELGATGFSVSGIEIIYQVVEMDLPYSTQYLEREKHSRSRRYL